MAAPEYQIDKIGPLAHRGIRRLVNRITARLQRLALMLRPLDMRFYVHILCRTDMEVCHDPGPADPHRNGFRLC
jgi:hypothetical protein